MGHDAFEFEGRLGTKSREERGEIFEACPLAAHTGVDFEVDWKGAGTQSGGARSGIKIVDLRGLPDVRSEAVFHDCLALTWKDAGHDHDSRSRTQTTRGHALLDTGDADPSGSCAHDRRSAEIE